jgi:hypothetical protein
MLALRFVAAAAETGDGACFDAAFAEAEAAFGFRDGALVVARAAALLRAAGREGIALALLPPACRALSRDEAGLLALLRDREAARAPAAGPWRQGRIARARPGDPAMLPRDESRAVLGRSTPVRAAGPRGFGRALSDLAAALAGADAALSGPADWTGSELAGAQFPPVLS